MTGEYRELPVHDYLIPPIGVGPIGPVDSPYPPPPLHPTPANPHLHLATGGHGYHHIPQGGIQGPTPAPGGGVGGAGGPNPGNSGPVYYEDIPKQEA